MGWRHDEKTARKLVESDPAAAIDLIERIVPEAEKSMLGGTERACDLLELKIKAAKRAGQPDTVAAAEAELRSKIDAAIAEKDQMLEDGTGGARAIAGALEAKARYLDRLGRGTEANRLRLHAADVDLAAIGDAGAKARLASTPFYVLTHGAMGLEMGRAFQHGYESNYRAAAEVLRDPLISEGKAVALARCERCGGVVEANWKKGRCLKKHKVDDVRVVLVEDADAVREEMAVALT